MEIVFGWSLDGHAFPDTAAGAVASFDAAVVGPHAFLGLLETRLGLGRPAIPRTLRIAEYLNALRRTDGYHFFSESLAADAWTTADHLLDMRDRLFAAGWSGRNVDGCLKVNSLAEVEKSCSVAAGFGERQQLVNEELKSVVSPVVKRIRHIGSLSMYPAAWVQTFELLKKSGTVFEELSAGGKAEGGDLRKLQQRLADDGGTIAKLQQRLAGDDGAIERIQFAGDGTVSVLDADDELQAALVLAAWLAQRRDCSDVVLIRGNDCSVLNKALQRFGLASIGNNARAKLKAVLQILPLAFKISSRPVDPDAVAEFVCLAGGPIPEWISKQLIGALSSAAGIGGTFWKEAWDKCVQMQSGWIARDQPELSKKETLLLAREKVEPFQKWFVERIQLADKFVTAAHAQEICTAVEQWATAIAGRRIANRIGVPSSSEARDGQCGGSVSPLPDSGGAGNLKDDIAASNRSVEPSSSEARDGQCGGSLPPLPDARIGGHLNDGVVSTNRGLYEVAAGQARMLKQLIVSQGAERIPIAQMEKMIDAVLNYGSSLSTAEAADWSLVDAPGQIWDTADTVIWWGFAQSSWAHPERQTWSQDELDVLHQNGIHLDDLTHKLQRENMSWRQPILNAGKRVILVKPRVVAGQRAVAHPLWDELAAMIDVHSMKVITTFASQAFLRAELDFAQSKVSSDEQKVIPLPQPLRTWTVRQDAIQARKNESFSSIEKMLGCPLSWTLQYQCGMYQPKALNLPRKQLLLGRLAHEVAKHLYEENSQWKPAEAKASASRIVSKLIPEIAAILLLPGAGPQLREATEAIPNSIYELVKFLSDAKVTVEGTEVELKTRLDKDTLLKGNVDMLVRLPSGGRAILDFKWSSAPEWYRQKLVEGNAIQLALYSWLALKDNGKPSSPEDNVIHFEGMPPSGFYMFRQSRLMFTAAGVFPDHTLVRRMMRDLGETWKLTLEQYQRLLTEMKSGSVVATGIVDDNAPIETWMQKKLVEPPCKFCELSHFCGKTELS